MQVFSSSSMLSICYVAGTIFFACILGFEAEGQADERVPKRLAERWGDITHERTNLLKDGDLVGNISADRRLPIEDLNLLLTTAQILIDKDYDESDRRSAAEVLGALGHQYAIPSLLAVLRDESDNGGVRLKVIIALSRIRDKRVVDYLIEDALTSRSFHGNLSAQAEFQLRLILSGSAPGVGAGGFKAGGPEDPGPDQTGLPDDPKAREDELRVWREWWKKNRDDVELKRDVFGSSGGL